jgi:hypothetical protein
MKIKKRNLRDFENRNKNITISSKNAQIDIAL